MKSLLNQIATAYLANAPSTEGFSPLASLQGLIGLEGGGIGGGGVVGSGVGGGLVTNTRQHHHTQSSRMQPTLPQSNAGSPQDMDLPAAQSMDWLFKKERIYLLAQFWQQVCELIFFIIYSRKC